MKDIIIVKVGNDTQAATDADIQSMTDAFSEAGTSQRKIIVTHQAVEIIHVAFPVTGNAEVNKY